jgi:hypothetical protein
MSYLNIEALKAAPLATEPFEYLILPGFVRPGHATAITRDYPDLGQPGSFNVNDVAIGGAAAALIEELSGPAFREAIEAKFGLDLSDSPTLFTVRGVCDADDGRIHTDSKTKIITVLLYLNPDWAPDGGRLRLLRNGEDLEDFVAEVPPDFGTLLVFRRSETSWHGHRPFSGPRRVLQMNWVTSNRVAAWQQFRHRISAAVKRLSPTHRAKVA